MSNGNNGFNETPGYNPPGGTQAFEEKRAREAAEAQRKQAEHDAWKRTTTENRGGGR